MPTRISKREWAGLGGFTNPHLFRRRRGRVWHYFKGA